MPSLITQIFTGSPEPMVIAFAVFAVDCLMGDPAWLYSRIPHPVVFIGNLISALEQRFNRFDYSNTVRFVLGVLVALTVMSVATATGVLLTEVSEQIPAGTVILIVLASSLIAYRGLYDGVAKVWSELGQSLDDGRQAVSHIVGRDPKSLNEAGVARAAIESLAENFSDGTVAPLFWFLILGLPGLLFYKAVNTLDSMIGHRNERYEYFGKFAARLDDAVNYIPARLTGLLISCAAFLIPGLSGKSALQTLRKDAHQHKSVNAGWQEAAVAGALGISLAGPRKYGDELVEDVWMNAKGRKDVTARDIRQALRLYQVSGLILFCLLLGCAAVSLS